MRVSLGVVAIACAVAITGACRNTQRNSVDSAAGVAGSSAGTTLSLVDVQMGRHLDANRKIVDATDDFAPTDTVYASVHTSGKATAAPVTGRWMFENGNIIDQKTDTVTTNGDAYSVFFIVKPGGLPTGKYTIHVLVNGTEVRAKDATVK
jgi:type II secretory pathway pseudopilin PulG